MTLGQRVQKRVLEGLYKGPGMGVKRNGEARDSGGVDLEGCLLLRSEQKGEHESNRNLNKGKEER